MSVEYLESLFTRFGTDKGTWGYTAYYATAMEARRFDVKAVLEVGICGYRDIPNNVVGASLFVWREYFPNAEIYGIDNDSRFIFNDQPRIHTALADAYDVASLSMALIDFNVGRPFDMIVDDAVHDPEPQLHLANMLTPALAKGGRYFIEEACPYKLNEPYENWLSHRINLAGEITGIHACVTPKPEELMILIK